MPPTHDLSKYDLGPLVRFDAQIHATLLWESFSQDDGAMWTYLPIEPPQSVNALADDIVSRIENKGFETFVIIDPSKNGACLGMTSFLRHDADNLSVEIGYIAYSPSLRRSRLATLAHYHMIKLAFDQGMRRVEWKCDQLNVASNKAALRLGFSYEGTFRNHMISKQRRRDTCWYSLIKEDWPQKRARLEAWLSADNFDDNGLQKSGLSDLGL